MSTMRNKLQQLVLTGALKSFVYNKQIPSYPGDYKSRLIDELFLTFSDGQTLNLSTFCSGCMENTSLFLTEPTKPTNPEKSKFANDSYKKLKRDSKGHFIKMEDCNSNNMKENCNCNTCKGFEELLNDLAPKRISGNLDDEDECNCEDCCENPDCEGHKSFTTFELGYNDGRHDMLHGHNPTYISSDINIIGDSDYIEGYIDGFNSLPI